MLTLEKARQSVLAAVKNAPRGKRNPTDSADAFCVYDDGNGCHCIAGQVLADNGLPLPETNNGFRQDVVDLERTGQIASEAVEFLGDIQTVFDERDAGDYKLLTWRQSLAEAKSIGLFTDNYDYEVLHFE